MGIYNDTAAIAALGLVIGFLVILALASYIITSLFLMKIFDKAGVQGKWRAWVPVYNSMVFLKLGDLSPWLVLYALGATMLLSWIPVIGQIIAVSVLAVMAMAAYRVGQKLQKEGAWVVLYIFLSIVWLGINAFDKSRWNTQIAPAPWAGKNFFTDTTVWDGVPVQPSNAPPAGGYGAAPQGYGAPAPGYTPPQGQGAAPQGYVPPAAGQVPPVTPPAPGAPPVPPAPGAPPAPPTQPPAPPTQP